MTANADIGRRTVIKSLAGAPVAGLSLAAVLADPLIARAVAAGLTTVSTTTKGGRAVNAALALPAETPAPAVLLVHEWWGLNDQIKSVAAELAKEGYVALAVDFYGGRVADTPDAARALMSNVDGAAAVETAVAWIDWLKSNDQTNGKIATIGWCFGGGWSLNASLSAPVDATVIYYGSVGPEFGGIDRTPQSLAKLAGPVLGHYADRDGWITKDMVAGFEAAMAEAGKSNASYWYQANHAFANPTQAPYDEADAALAWTRTLDFLKENLRG
ncbi:MAG: dienelactone hydrolase family protein [Alphaproteobacteria bacterium]|nr:dienelactone hydrolase family protein [Alphaproteobacteria bacterium]